jgi:phosphoglycolate phosphatase
LPNKPVLRAWPASVTLFHTELQHIYNRLEKKLQIVIFDMDGTLIDSGHDITVSINYTRKTVYGLGPLKISFVIEAINRDQRNLAQLFYERKSYDQEAKTVFEAHYHGQCVKTPRLYNGIGPLLDALAAVGVRRSVATNAPAIFAEKMLTHLGVVDQFDYIIGSEDVQHSKPHPAMLLSILDDYGFQAKRDYAVMAGDNSKDMEAARRTGIPGVFVTWGFSPTGEGDFVLSEPEELLQLLQAAGGREP